MRPASISKKSAYLRINVLVSLVPQVQYSLLGSCFLTPDDLSNVIVAPGDKTSLITVSVFGVIRSEQKLMTKSDPKRMVGFQSNTVVTLDWEV